MRIQWVRACCLVVGAVVFFDSKDPEVSCQVEETGSVIQRQCSKCKFKVDDEWWDSEKSGYEVRGTENLSYLVENGGNRMRLVF